MLLRSCDDFRFHMKSRCGVPGGALNLNSAVNVTVMSSVFRGNEAQNGGGVCVKQCERSTFFDNSFTGNWADNSGGALFQLQCNGALQSYKPARIVVE